MYVAGGTTDGLDKGAVATEKALLVCIEDGDKADLREVETFAQEVDTHQHIEDAHAKVAHDFHTLEGINIGMYIFTPDTQINEI